jgi:hypothetical protein
VSEIGSLFFLDLIVRFGLVIICKKRRGDRKLAGSPPLRGDSKLAG